MACKKYTVKQGDCISSIAFEHGFFPDTLWNDPMNSQLKQDRQDPNVLMPGDQVYIRKLEPKKALGATDKRHPFRRKGVPEKLQVQFLLADKPRAHQAYDLNIDGDRSRGQTDADGRITISIPPNAKTGTIRFKDPETQYQLNLGHLDPITEITGIQGRLQNLGFYSGPLDGQMSQALIQALRDFQAAQEPNQEPSGNLDQQTQKQIEDAYGG
jgi:hypothetical protein